MSSRMASFSSAVLVMPCSLNWWLTAIPSTFATRGLSPHIDFYDFVERSAVLAPCSTLGASGPTPPPPPLTCAIDAQDRTTATDPAAIIGALVIARFPLLLPGFLFEIWSDYSEC